jgi:hypothetical protein
MTRFFWKIYWKLSGWKIQGEFPKDLRQCIIVVAPHTSAWDVVIGMAGRSFVPIQDAHFLGKKELFAGPMGWFFKAVGGVPVDRSGQQNMVDQVAALFESRPDFKLACHQRVRAKWIASARASIISPEANVPLVLAGLDFERKALIFSKPSIPLIMKLLISKNHLFFAPIQGKYPSWDGHPLP